MNNKNKEKIIAKQNASESENSNRNELLEMMKKTPVIDEEVLQNLSLFLTRQNLSEILFIHELYQHIIDTHGIIMEFGVRWGRNMALYHSLRGIYEPFNHNRKIVGFDTFTGFPSVDKKDGLDEIVNVGSFNVTENYDVYLEKILGLHEKESPISHIKKFEIVKGDATETTAKYLKQHPETIISLAYFDFDIYEPTKAVLNAIKPHLTKGSVIGFDQINNKTYPGETIALSEVLGLNNYRIKHSKYSPSKSYLIFE